jgi:hypothetical protein
MLTDQNVRLAELHGEIMTKNINNITKLALLAAVGAGGLMVVCFLGAAVALVLGLSDSCVLVPFGTAHVWDPRVQMARTSMILEAQVLMLLTYVPHLP